MPDATVVPFGSPEGPSKAARRVGNTGPQPATRRPTQDRTAQPRPAAARVPAPAPAAEPAAVVAVPARPTPRKRVAVPTPAPAPVLVPDVDLDLEPADTDGWLDFVRRRMSGDYAVDEFGFDPELTDRILLTLARPLYRSWFRVEATGLDNVPGDSGALVVANHSGTIAMDSLMAQVALFDEHPAHRHLRMLGANLVFQTPFVGEIARKAGHTLACHPDAERLLSAGDSSISTRPWPRLASPPVRWCVRHPPGCCGPGVLERRVVWLSPVRVVGRPARVRNQMQQESRRTAYREVLASPRQRPRRPQFSRRSARRQPRGAGRAVRPWPSRSVPVPDARRACSPPGRARSMPRVCRQARLLVSRVCRPGARTPA